MSKKEENILIKKLDECDYNIQCKYHYIDDQCCVIEDEELEVVKEIEELKVELEIAKRMDRDDEEIKDLESDIKENEEYLDYLYDRQEILEDLWEEETYILLKD